MTAYTLVQRLASAVRAFLHPAGKPQHRMVLDGLECSDDAITITGPDGCLVYFNSRFPAFYPILADHIALGVSFRHLLMLGADRGQFHAIGPHQAADWVRQRLQRQVIAESSFEQHLSDGRWIEVVERRLPQGGHIAIRRDITQRKNREAALQADLHLTQDMIDAIPFPVYVRDGQGCILRCNAKFAEASGRPQAALIGKPLEEVLPTGQAEDFQAQEDALIHQGVGSQTIDVTGRWFDGSLRHLSITRTVLILQDGTIFGCLGIVVDITAQKRAEERLVQQTKLATLGQIASEVAHEVNQPLSIIRLAAEDCLSQHRANKLDCATAQRKLEQIIGQVARMSELTDQLRGFSRPDQSRPIPFSPVQRVRGVVDLLKAQFRLDDIALSLDITPDCPDILGRPHQMDQVLLNLLSNAREALRHHMKPGRGWVGVRLDKKPPYVRMTVEDNGPGIPPSLLPVIFEPFVTTKAEQAGTGLGLSICANIITAMGGVIQAENLYPGARFTILLPIPRPAGAAADCDDTAAPALISPASSPMPPLVSPPLLEKPVMSLKIVLVDDEPLALECLGDILIRLGHQVQTAERGVAALDLLRDQSCDVLITDYRLPGGSGIDLIQQARDLLPGLPAIILSGDNIADLALPDGVRSLEKPVHTERLLTLLPTMAYHSARPDLPNEQES